MMPCYIRPTEKALGQSLWKPWKWLMHVDCGLVAEISVDGQSSAPDIAEWVISWEYTLGNFSKSFT